MLEKVLKYFKQNHLYFVVFITGACVLIIEVLATRILAPFYGTTIYSVSSILGVILAGLSLGYYFGGIMADKKPDKKIFFFIIIFAGVSVLILQLIELTLLPYLSNSFNIKSGPVFFSVILFLLPSFLLGLLSPFVIKLETINSKNDKVGTVSGKVFFYSTIGSISGSFAAGFYLIPNFGIDQILVGVCMVLILIGFLGGINTDKENITKKLVVLSAVILTLNLTLLNSRKNNSLYSKNGVYQKIYFVRSLIDNKIAKVLMLDANPSAAAFYNSDELAFEYSKYFEIYKYFNNNSRDFLFIGGGGYNMPFALAKQTPEASIDVVEVEPELYEIAVEQFGHTKRDNITNHIQDGRVFLKKSKKYDVILTDAYSNLYSIPVHLTTQEFFKLGYDKLNDNGIFIAYIIGKLDDSREVFALSEYNTFSSVFENNYVFAVDDPFSKSAQNILFVGYKSEKNIDFKNKHIGKNDEVALDEHLIDMKQFDLSKQYILTDNYAPIEALNTAIYDEL